MLVMCGWVRGRLEPWPLKGTARQRLSSVSCTWIRATSVSGTCTAGIRKLYKEAFLQSVRACIASHPFAKGLPRSTTPGHVAFHTYCTTPAMSHAAVLELQRLHPLHPLHPLQLLQLLQLLQTFYLLQLLLAQHASLPSQSATPPTRTDLHWALRAQTPPTRRRICASSGPCFHESA